MFSTDVNCYDYFLNSTKQLNKYCAIKYFGIKIYNNKFVKDTERLSNYFLSLGLKQGDSFCIFLPNMPHAMVSFYALNKIGVVANMVHPVTPPSVLKKYLKETNSKGILILDILGKNYTGLLKELNINVIVCRNSDYINDIRKPFFKLYELFKGIKTGQNFTAYFKAVKYNNIHICPQTVKGYSPATYMHSSGTSGDAKTVVINNFSYNNLVKNLLTLSDGLIPKSDCTLAALPLFHAYGLGVGLLVSMCKGLPVILMPKFSAKAAVKHLRKNRVALVAGVPAMFNKMMREKNFEGRHLKNLKQIYCGGDAARVSMVKEFNARIRRQKGKAKLCSGYGLTETCSVIATNTNDNYKLGSNGKPLNENTIEIWDVNNKKLHAGTIGEIAVSGPTLMQGYYNSINNGIYKDKHGKTWIKTGDYGYLDNDGYLFYTSRKKRLIKISAFNIFPGEIENTVLELKLIKEACAVEASSDGKQFIRLFVTVQSDNKPEEDIKKLVNNICEEKLNKYARPREIIIIKEMPYTSFAKIDYLKLEKMKIGSK